PKSWEYFDRLWLMAIVPGAFLIAFILIRRSIGNFSSWPSYGVLAVALTLAAISRTAVEGPYMIEGAATELKEFRAQIVNRQSTLVVAPHGLEWWAGYFLDTPVRMKLLPDASRYKRVLRIVHTIAFKPPDAGPGFSPRPLGPPALRIYGGTYVNVYELPRTDN